MVETNIEAEPEILAIERAEEYIEAARLREIVTADLFHRLDKNLDKRRDRAYKLDRKMASSFPANPRPSGCVNGIYLVGPELSDMLGEALELALKLSSMGFRVHLLTRLPLTEAQMETAKGGNVQVHLIRPLDDYNQHIPEHSMVVTFYLPASARLLLKRIKHVCVLKSVEPPCYSVPGYPGVERSLASDIVFYPDSVFVLATPKEKSIFPRTAFPLSIDNLIYALEAKRPAPPIPPGIPTISACMIAKDEEGMIEDCLLSLVPVADQVVVNDTGSSDRTADVARMLGAECFITSWQDDFAGARNLSLDKAIHEYVLVIDADERISKESQAVLKRELLSRYEAYTVEIRENSGDATFKHGDSVRIFKNRPSYRFSGKIHEQIVTSIRGSVKRTSIVFNHVGYNPVLNDLKKKRKRNVDLLVQETNDSNLSREYVLFQSGVELVLSRNYPDGLECLLKSYESSPVDTPYRPMAALRICQAYVALGRLREAQTFVRQALSEYPGFLELAELLAQGLIEGGLYHEAKEILQLGNQAPQRKDLPKSCGADTYRLELLSAHIALGLGQEHLAFEYLFMALNRCPEFEPAQRLLVLRWPEKGIETLSKIHPKSVRPAVSQYLIQGLLEKAAELAALFQDDGALGEVFLARKDYNTAALHFLSSRETWDRQRGQTLVYTGLATDSTLKAEPISPIVRRVMQGLPCKTGEAPTAVRLLDFLLEVRAIDWFIKGLDSLRGFERADLLIGKLLVNRGFYHIAYKRLSEASFKDLEILELLLDICYRLQLWKEVVGYSEAVRKIRYLTPQEYTKYVYSLVKTGEISKAKYAVREAMTLYPDNATIGQISSLMESV
ncbi:MAG TPA: glycosyltransferase [Firmicutes bacterium]|nr:glycosyltransferase [Candidatus Fermentithermobacillaceae bacterium]